MNKIELLWEYYKEQRSGAERYDQQRTSITGFTFVSASALFAVLSNQNLGQYSGISSLFLISLGVVSLLLVRKLHERSELNYSRAREALLNIEDELEDQLYSAIKCGVEEKHSIMYRLTAPIRLHHIWMIPHVLIIAIGITWLINS